MDFVKTFKNRRLLITVLFASGLFSLLVGYQNCAPANFRKLASDKTGTSACQDNPALCPEPPERDCRGFSIITRPQQIMLPDGMSTIAVNLEGQLGNAKGPMQWTVEPGQLNPKLGLTTTINVGVGTHKVVARSGNNLCEDSFTLKVYPSQCQNPSALSFNFKKDTPDDQTLTNRDIQFSITDFSKFKDVQVQWGMNTSWLNVTQSPFSKRFNSGGAVIATAKAKDKVCDHEFQSSIEFFVIDPTCAPDIANIDVTPLTPNPSADRKVDFRVNNFDKLFEGKVHVTWLPNTTTTHVSNNVSYEYPAVTADTTRTIVFKARDKKCNHEFERSFTHVQKQPCQKQISALNVVADRGPNIRTIDPVNFTVNHQAADFTSFNFNLGNGVTGSTINVPNPQYYNTSSTQSFTAVFTASGPKTCNEVLRKEIPFTVTLEKVTKTFEVGVQTVKPDLRFFFIVDNSQTMLDKQTKLSNAFTAMFSDTNVGVLNQFNSSFYIFNTTQRTHHLGSPVNDNPYFPENVAQNTSYYGIHNTTGATGDQYSYTGTRRMTTPAYTKFGRIAGDVLGFTHSISGATHGFNIAPVSLFAPNDPGGQMVRPTQLFKFDQLTANSDNTKITNLINNFKARINILNPNYYSQTTYDATTQVESGMCAMARILRDPQYLPANVQTSFVIVTDEDEQMISGSGCVKQTGTVYYDEGYCGNEGSQIFYEIPNDSCDIRYPYRVQYYYYEKVVSKSVTTRYCALKNDSGECIDWDTRTNTYTQDCPNGDCSSILNGSYCSDDPDPNITVECSESSKIQYTSGSLPSSGPLPTYGTSCPDDIIASLPSNYVPGSCKYNYLLYTSQTVAKPAGETCEAQLPPVCSQANSNCQAYESSPTNGEIVIPVKGLSCSSQCPAGQSSKCGYGLIREYINSQFGGQCTGSNPNYIYQVEATKRVPVGTPVADRCVAPLKWQTTQANIPSQNEVDYVGGKNAQGQLVPLNTYIKSRFTELQSAGYKPTMTTFTYKTTPPISDPGTSIGTKYHTLMDELGYSTMKHSVTDTSYGPALSNLTQFIKQILSAIFNLTLAPRQEIRSIHWQRGTATPVKVISGYTHANNQIKFEATITLEGNVSQTLADRDKLIVEYW